MVTNDNESLRITVIDRVAVAVNALQEKKAAGIKVIQMGELIVITEYFVICSGLNPVHLKAMASHVKKTMGEHGIRPRHEEGSRASQWILQDYEDFVVHLFLEETRTYYDIEGLWSDAPEVPMNDLVEIGS